MTHLDEPGPSFLEVVEVVESRTGHHHLMASELKGCSECAAVFHDVAGLSLDEVLPNVAFRRVRDEAPPSPDKYEQLASVVKRLEAQNRELAELRRRVRDDAES